MQLRQQWISAAGFALLAFTVCPAAPAQNAAPVRARVTITHVKPDMQGEWITLERDSVVPALKKAGVKTRTVYATSIWGNAYEYVLISPFDNTSEYDGTNPVAKALGQPGTARLNEMLRKCTESSTSYMFTRMADISNVLDTAPEMIVTARYRIAQGKLDEFRSMMKSEVLPVYKKANMGLIVNQRGPGANPNDVTVSTAYKNFAAMNDGPFLTQQLGQEAAAKINSRFNGIRTLMEVVARRKVAELSF